MVDIQTGPNRKIGGSMYKILIVEDSNSLRSKLVAAIDRRQFQVVEALDGEDGLKKFSEHNDIDIVFTELLMPGLMGPEMLRKIREKNSQRPIIFAVTSAFINQKLKNEMDYLDIAKWLPKPVVFSQISNILYQACNEYLGKSSPLSLANSAALGATDANGKIIVVEKSSQIREKIDAFFANKQHEIIYATDDQEVLDVFNKYSDVSLIIADLEVLKGAAFEMLRKIRKVEEGSNLPVVFSVSFQNLLLKHEAEELGARVFTKPFDLDEVQTFVESQLINLVQKKDHKKGENLSIDQRFEALYQSSSLSDAEVNACRKLFNTERQVMTRRHDQFLTEIIEHERSLVLLREKEKEVSNKSEPQSLEASAIPGFVKQLETPLSILNVTIAAMTQANQNLKSIVTANSDNDSTLSIKQLNAVGNSYEQISALLKTNLNRSVEIAEGLRLLYPSGKVDSIEEFSLFDLIKTVIDKVEQKYRHLKPKFSNRISGDFTISQDLEKVTAVIRHVLENAVEHGGSDNGPIEIQAADQGGNVVIDVSDLGQGVGDLDSDQIFKAFYTTKPQQGKVGLGLYISQMLLQKIKGSISCRREGDKTVFTLTLGKDLQN